MLFVIFCVDKDDHGHVRAANRPAHLAHLKSLGERLKLAGPMTTEDGSAMTGSLIVIEAVDLAAAQAVAAADPYAQAGLFARADVRPWRQAIPAPN